MSGKKKQDKKEEKKTNTPEESTIPKEQTCEEKLMDMISTVQRVQADFENYKKRVEREKQEMSKFSNSLLIKKLLPLLDNFEMGLKNTNQHEEFLKGIELIFSQFTDVLKDEKVEKIKTVGEKFDPNLHQALMAEESEDNEPNTVIEEFQSGYMIGERILRAAKVKVSK